MSIRAEREKYRKKAEIMKQTFKYGVKYLGKKHRRPSEEGAIFAYYIGEDKKWRFGRYIKHNCAQGFSLVYFYGATSDSKDEIPKLDKWDLIIPPQLCDFSGDYYFTTVEKKPVKSEDIHEQHYFVNPFKKERFFNEYKEEVTHNLPKVGDMLYGRYSFPSNLLIFDRIYRKLGFEKAIAELDAYGDFCRKYCTMYLSNFDSDIVADYNAEFVKSKDWQKIAEETLISILEKQDELGILTLATELEAIYVLEAIMAVRGYPSEDIDELKTFEEWVKKHKGEEVSKSLMKLANKMMMYLAKDSLSIQKGQMFPESKEFYRQLWIKEILRDMKKRWQSAKKNPIQF